MDNFTSLKEYFVPIPCNETSNDWCVMALLLAAFFYLTLMGIIDQCLDVVSELQEYGMLPS